MNSNIISGLTIIIVATFLLAAYLGYRKGKLKGLLKIVIFTFFTVALGIVGVILALIVPSFGAVGTGDNPVRLSNQMGVGLTLFALVFLAGMLGYFGNRTMGAIIVTFLALLAATISVIATIIGGVIADSAGAWTGLIIGIIVAGQLVGQLFKAVANGDHRTSQFATLLWYSVSFTAIYGYLLGDWLGLLIISITTVLVFWTGLYFLSGYILPLKKPVNWTDQNKAFRSLVTFTIGTNYPYYFVDDKSQPELRVPGNQFRQFFAGPGVVYTPCDHAAYITDGKFVKGVKDPGLSFTGIFDREPLIFDLRPQLRAFPVEAVTKDGIVVDVITFIPYQIDTAGKKPELGQSFPHSKQAIHAIVARQLVQRQDDKEQSGTKHFWDGGPNNGLIPSITRPIMRDIISHYSVDDLCDPRDDPNRDPRVEIVNEMKSRVQAMVAPMGLKLVGGGISNLVPRDSHVIDRRLENWRTKWKARIISQRGKAEALEMQRLELARNQVETDAVKFFSQFINGNGNHSKLGPALALRYIDTIADIISNSATGQEVFETDIDEY